MNQPLSLNFSTDELEASQTAIRAGRPNTIPAHLLPNAKHLAQTILQPLREYLMRPIHVTSGYRSARINSMVGGASSSEHLFKKGEGAVDFFIEGVDIYKVQDWCDKHWDFSLGYGAAKNFVHLGIRSGRPRVRWDY